ncbi:SZRD1 isoform 6 [Pongo abelii]|uniref:SZRD1 isoform 6 n=1 Tax=Pongo abelii TaxID=9601 RepID=A0A2J8S954_PONAB|nr:SZRD1 isoform 6 [Pongo abelii]
MRRSLRAGKRRQTAGSGPVCQGLLAVIRQGKCSLVPCSPFTSPGMLPASGVWLLAWSMKAFGLNPQRHLNSTAVKAVFMMEKLE